MKKCPSCQKTYDDNLKFCQSDGTPLVAAAEGKSFEDDVFEIPVEKNEDVLKTAVISGNTDDNIKVTVPEEKFDEYDLPSPSSAQTGFEAGRDKVFETPMPEPLNEPKSDPPRSPFAEPEINPAVEQIDDWSTSPPPAPVQQWDNNAVGQNMAFETSPTAAGAVEGQNKTLAIVSLVLGILSIPCCSWIVFSIAAMITGFLAKKKADENPEEYGGRSLALAGMIMGAVTLVLGVILSFLFFLGKLPGSIPGL